MAFRWKKRDTKRRIIIERADIVYWTRRSFHPLKKFRENRNFLPGETWVDISLLFKKIWQFDEVNGVMTRTSTYPRSMCVSAHTGAGILFAVGNASGYYHGPTNADHFEKRLN
jgi:hypothetical protein